MNNLKIKDEEFESVKIVRDWKTGKGMGYGYEQLFKDKIDLGQEGIL